MADISDRLKRLHSSRVRAKQAAADASDARESVYHADDVVESVVTRSRDAERDAWRAVGASEDGDLFWLDNVIGADERHGRHSVGAVADVSLSDITRQLLGLFAAPASIDEVVFFDIETAGLGEGPGNEAWCVGLGRWQESHFRVRHYVLPHPDLEAPMLRAVAEELSSAKVLVSFNGAAFDVPRLESHFARQGIEARLPKDHIDLLKVVRRLFARDEAKSLAEAERVLLGFERAHDVPGSESPRRWSTYLRTLVVRPLLPLIEHNKLDIVSLAVLLAHVDDLIAGRSAKVEPTRPAKPPRSNFVSPEPKVAEPASEFRTKLVRSYRLKSKSVRRQPRKPVETRPVSVAPKPVEGVSVGDRLRDLRRQASRYLEAGDDAAAIPLLHEMVALSPRNPFPLAELARYYREVGDEDLASLFESRLSDVAPY